MDRSWKNLLGAELKKDYFIKIKHFVSEDSKKNTVFPPMEKLFTAFDYTPLDNIKVVILGQDPYHNTGQANGLAFSVSDGMKIPPSLKNIYKELESDLGISPAKSGNLETWAKQGVFLLNATLSVRAHSPGSHQKIGWELFTDKVIELISTHKEHIVFILWGKFAQAKASLIDPNKHLVLTSYHPSPFSARHGFFGCKHFSKANSYLESHQISPVHWKL